MPKPTCGWAGRGPGTCRCATRIFYARVLAQGSLGLGESYMDGWWDAPALDGLLTRLLQARLEQRVHGAGELWDALRARVLNLQSRRRGREVGERHYDLGNDLYAAMLGRRLVYSCGYWTQADGRVLADLDAAQEAKLDLVCRKLRLRPGMRVLDIGCGWGEALKFAAERYGVSGVGVTISRQQADYAQALCAGLPVEIRLQDYRDIDGSYDAVFSIGMFEHVGVKNYRAYFELAHRCLPPGGLFLLHTIGSRRSVDHTDPWIARYIFPNSMLPSAAQIAQAVEELFVVEDWHNSAPTTTARCRPGATTWSAPVHAARALRHAFPAHVALLPGRLHGHLPHPALAAVAGGAVEGRGAGRIPGAAKNGAFVKSGGAHFFGIVIPA